MHFVTIVHVEILQPHWFAADEGIIQVDVRQSVLSRLAQGLADHGYSVLDSVLGSDLFAYPGRRLELQPVSIRE